MLEKNYHNSINPLYCILGKSGSGKSELVENLVNEFDFLSECKSYTTRPRRSINESGHTFVSDEEFDCLDLVAHTIYNGYKYGADEDMLNESDLYIIDVQGLYTLLNSDYPKQRKIITVYLDVESDKLESRMKNRGDSKDDIIKRKTFDNNNFEDAIKLVDIVIDANKTEREVLIDFIDKTAMFELKN